MNKDNNENKTCYSVRLVNKMHKQGNIVKNSDSVSFIQLLPPVVSQSLVTCHYDCVKFFRCFQKANNVRSLVSPEGDTYDDKCTDNLKQKKVTAASLITRT